MEHDLGSFDPAVLPLLFTGSFYDCDVAHVESAFLVNGGGDVWNSDFDWNSITLRIKFRNIPSEQAECIIDRLKTQPFYSLSALPLFDSENKRKLLSHAFVEFRYDKSRDHEHIDRVVELIARHRISKHCNKELFVAHFPRVQRYPLHHPPPKYRRIK